MVSEITNIQNLKKYQWYFVLAILSIGALYWEILGEMVTQWSNDDNYSHGFLIPFISGYFIYEKRQQLADLPTQPSRAGILLIFFALLVLIAGHTAIEYFSMRSSLIILLCGMTLYLFGWPTTKLAALPLLYLFFMVPIPYIIYDAVAFPLKLFVAKYSVFVLKLAGMPVIREGNIIMFPEIVLEVADACSGIRSLISLLALSVACAFMTQQKTGARIAVALSAIPIALLTNGIRVIVTGILSRTYGASVATGFFHEFAGLSVFVVAMVILGMFVLLMRRWA
jgi:exosortase